MIDEKCFQIRAEKEIRKTANFFCDICGKEETHGKIRNLLVWDVQLGRVNNKMVGIRKRCEEKIVMVYADTDGSFRLKNAAREESRDGKNV